VPRPAWKQPAEPFLRLRSIEPPGCG
jgi:hypothetical protein